MRCDIPRMGVQERKRIYISSNDDREFPQTDIRYQSKYPGSSKDIRKDKWKKKKKKRKKETMYVGISYSKFRK